LSTNVSEGKKPGLFARISRSIRDMRGEMKRVVWPTRKQVINNTLVVIAFMMIAALLVGAFDTILVWLRTLLLGVGA